jgi:hypothetical protein
MTAGANGVTVNDIGAIQSFVLPVNWVEKAPAPEIGGRQLRQFHLINRPDLRFCSYLRTLPLSHQAAAAFQEILYSEFHKVSQTELDRLDAILEPMANAQGFQIVDATTDYLNSRRVLTLQGRWLKMLEETVSCFVDVKGDGLYVQQIYFTAPQGEFEKYANIANEIFVSINWKH